MALWIVLLVFFMAELLVYSWCRVQYVHTGYEIDEARNEKQRLLALNYELKVEDARLRSPERIRRLARDRGLVMPEARQIVVIP
jgi:cell division protein FtsL